MEKLLDNSDFSDVVFVLQSGTRVHAHKCILAARSQYFARCFHSCMKEGQCSSSSVLELPIEESCAETDFRRMLRWLYTGCLLYTSDAADEEDSVDLGGRRIIKKKK
eukprot:TRINITY_DN12226_c0_g1_i2.p2 TRINITY_DN12226_c0_g1~~TRINITY_DN12226_c0_g1_i2.p2  ORF type:complete len:107 (+),score=27.24 TRINITY_DN12226_c0_g1_i2:384-704(+)